MKLFYFNLNNAHTVAEQSMADYNPDVQFFRTIDSPEVNIFHHYIRFKNYNQYVPVLETSKPLFDYYLEHKAFDFDRIKQMYDPINVEFGEGTILEHLKKIDANIEYVKELKPDIVFLRYYFSNEFYLLYFLEGIKDLNCFKSIGGINYNYESNYYIDKFLEHGLIDNFHDGYGEEHLRNIVNGDKINPRTKDPVLKKDDFSIPCNKTHFITSTLKCSGKCLYCGANTFNNSRLDTDIDFTSTDYIEFCIDRIKEFESYGVQRIILPSSISFYNKQHLDKFHKLYMQKGLKVQFQDCYFKFEDLDSESCAKMKEMNFYSIKVGLEHINPDIREKLGKYFSNSVVLSAIKDLREQDIKLRLSFMHNIPFETLPELLQNHNFMQEQKLTSYAYNRFNLIEGTVMHENPEEYGLQKKINPMQYVYYERKEPVNNTMHGIVIQKINKDNKPYENYFDVTEGI